jgi:peptidylprolyl isomerase
MIDRNRALAILAAGSAVLGLAACGSKAPGIVLAPSAGTTSVPVPTTPKPPPALASKPTIPFPGGAAPHVLITKDLIVGTGAVATPGKSLTVNYVGALYKGHTEFDSSWSTGRPFAPFVLGQGAVIPGWDKGLVGMRVGGRRLLVIPPALGYGAKGSPPKIPGNSTLVFVVDLLAVS